MPINIDHLTVISLSTVTFKRGMGYWRINLMNINAKYFVLFLYRPNDHIMIRLNSGILNLAYCTVQSGHLRKSTFELVRRRLGRWTACDKLFISQKRKKIPKKVALFYYLLNIKHEMSVDSTPDPPINQPCISMLNILELEFLVCISWFEVALQNRIFERECWP